MRAPAIQFAPRLGPQRTLGIAIVIAGMVASSVSLGQYIAASRELVRIEADIRSAVSSTERWRAASAARKAPQIPEAKIQAINNAMGGHKPAVYAPKSALGHSVGAVGAVESILTVLALKHGVIPPTLNLKNLDPEIDLDVVAGSPRPGNYTYAINNSFGFGGHNVALAFGKY